MKNAELAYQVLDLIEANPQHWDQIEWHCGTSHCFAGFVECIVRDINFAQAFPEAIDSPELVEIFSSLDNGDSYIDEVNKQDTWHNSRWTEEIAMCALGLTTQEASILFHASNTLENLKHYVSQFFGPR